MSDYKSLEFDIKWDPSSTLSIAEFCTPPQGGENGIAVWTLDYSAFSIRPTLATIHVPEAAANDWARVSVPIDSAISGIDPSTIPFPKPGD